MKVGTKVQLKESVDFYPFYVENHTATVVETDRQAKNFGFNNMIRMEADGTLWPVDDDEIEPIEVVTES